MLQMDMQYIHNIGGQIMKLAIIGSRSITAYPLEDVIPSGVTQIISGGARGVDALVRQYAQEHSIPLTEILPDYDRYGRGAPLRRNEEIVAKADMVLAIWDGQSRGTAYTIRCCRRLGKPVMVLA